MLRSQKTFYFFNGSRTSTKVPHSTALTRTVHDTEQGQRRTGSTIEPERSITKHDHSKHTKGYINGQGSQQKPPQARQSTAQCANQYEVAREVTQILCERPLKQRTPSKWMNIATCTRANEHISNISTHPDKQPAKCQQKTLGSNNSDLVPAGHTIACKLVSTVDVVINLLRSIA